MIDKVIGWDVGCISPQLQIQITPLSWGLVFCVKWSSIGLKVGPVAVRGWWGPINRKEVWTVEQFH